MNTISSVFLFRVFAHCLRSSSETCKIKTASIYFFKPSRLTHMLFSMWYDMMTAVKQLKSTGKFRGFCSMELHRTEWLARIVEAYSYTYESPCKIQLCKTKHSLIYRMFCFDASLSSIYLLETAYGKTIKYKLVRREEDSISIANNCVTRFHWAKHSKTFRSILLLSSSH